MQEQQPRKARVSITARTRQTRSLLGRQFGPIQAHVLPFILMQRGNLRGLSLVACQHPNLLLIENKRFACSCLPLNKGRCAASSTGRPLCGKASPWRDVRLGLAEGLEIK